ncbi:MAG: translocation/assembly module TamB domain-containing protein [Candidatus Latescibacteria bacterium]|nr:translocation/assembly module TamB domain-containing protein [bacterium]MCB9516946.1 translocation/assembly module TamB domain-containing protein [Candidatus Latescibacterota bacterium]
MRRHVRNSTLAALALFLLILVGALLFVSRNNPWLAERVAAIVTRNLLQARGYSLHLAGIEGRLPGELVLHGLRVSYEGPGHAPFDLFTAGRVALRFAPTSLLRGGFQGEWLELENGVLRAYPVEAEGWAYPGFDSPAGERSQVQVAVDQAVFDQLLILRETPAGRDTLRLGQGAFSLFRNSDGTSLDLQRLTLERPGRPTLHAAGLFILREGGRLTVAGVDLNLPESRLELRGDLALAEPRRLDVDISVNPARLRELAEAADAELDTDSYLRGTVHVGGSPDSLLLAGQLSGELYDFALDSVSCRGLYTDGRFHFSLLRGRVNESAVDGAASFTLPLFGREFGYSADTRLEHLDLATFFGSGLVTDLSGRLHAEDPGGDGRFRFTLGPGTLDRYPFAEAEGRAGLRGDSLRLMDVTLQDRGLDVTVDGVIRPAADSLDLAIEARSDGARLTGVFAGDSLLTGRVELSGRFAGPAPAPALSLDGRFEDLSYLGAHWQRGRFTLRGDALELAPLAIHAEGDSLLWLGVEADRYFVEASLLGDSLRLRQISLDAPDAAADLGGSVDLALLPPRLTLDRAWLRWLGVEWLNDRRLRVDLGDPPAIGPVHWQSEQGGVDLRWNRPESGPDRLRLDALDLAQLGPWLPARLGLAGRLSGDVERQPDGSLVARGALSSLVLDGEAAGHAEFALRWLGDSLAVDSLRWEPSPGRSLRVTGGLAGLPDVADGPGALAQLAPERLVADLDVQADRFPLERLTRLWPASAFIRGSLSGDLAVDGPLSDPAVHSEARLDSAAFWALGLDRLGWTAHLENGQLRVAHLDLARGASRLDGWLTLPLTLRLADGRGEATLRADGPLDGDLHLQADGADLLGAWDLLAEAGGRLEGDITLAGTVADPQPTGYLRLRDGTLRFAGWEERLSELSADGLVRGGTLEILSMHSREGIQWSRFKEGELSGQGWLTWLGPFRYGMSADFARCSFGTLPFFTGLVSGHLDLSTWEEEDVPPHPYLEGDIEVHEGTLSYSFQDVAETAGPTVAPVLSYDLRVRAEQNLMLVNDEANLELSGELELINTPSGQDVSGELQTLRGYYLVFGTKFYLIQGDLDFSSAADINPKIDILAEARNRDDRIQIHITNTFAEPTVDVVSEQGYGREDVLRILMGLPVGAEEGASGAAGTVVAGRVEAELLNRLERMVSGELAGLVDFGLENRNLAGAGEIETRWRIGRYLPGGFYISYNQGLSLDSDREVGLDYRLYNRLYLHSEVVNRGGQFADEGLINEYNVDIRFRYEY